MPNDAFYRSRKWFALRSRVLTAWKRSGLPCALCGRPIDWVNKSNSPIVDHIQPRRKRPDLELTFNNLQILCRTCHSSTKQAMERRAHLPSIGPDGWPTK